MKNNNLYGQLSKDKRYQAAVVGILALVIVLVLITSYFVIEITERRAHDSAEKLVSAVVDHIDEKMGEVRNATRVMSEQVSTRLDNPEALEQLILAFVEQNAFIYGSTVAFEPDIFPDMGMCYAPYVWIDTNGQTHSRQLGTETDYYQEEWYATTKETGKEYWCEPYFDEGGAKTMMCTFSIPLFDGSGNFVAILTADVGLDDLEEYISSITPSPDVYILLKSQKGNLLVNEESDSEDGNNPIVIKGVTEIGWSVELLMPFTYLMRGDKGIYFFIGLIMLFTVLFVFAINSALSKIRQRSVSDYINVITAISSNYSSIFIVNLLTNEMSTFRNPESYVDITGNGDDSFTSKLTQLIRHDCYEPDREMMLDEIRSQVIAEKLNTQDRYEVRFRKKRDDEVFWYEMMVFIMERDKNSAPVRAVIAFSNVNETVQNEKTYQDTLEQALKNAQSANKAKTDFLFNMSHDIRTPMNAIIGFTNMARKHVDDPDRVLDCLNKTQQSGNLLLSLINNVLDVSRIESGNAKLEESTIDIEYTFDSIRNTMEELATVHDISISFEMQNIQNRCVDCDIVRCNRVFVNIISNAIKYTREGGFVKVKCEQIENSNEEFGVYRYTFEDNGIGMSEEFQQNVFDQFTREQTSTVSGIQGSGLGLSVCKSFVELMGGTIECSSKQNEGTTFTVILPFRIHKNSSAADLAGGVNKESQGEIVLNGKRCLLVEDNEFNREIAEEILSDEGIIVMTANDGTEAVTLIKEKGPDCFDFVLMDIQMPVMNGYKATRKIRELFPGSGLPIIALSANAFEEDKRASREAGMDDHVAKPINITELYTTLSRYICC